MLGRSQMYRAAAIAALIVVLVASFVAVQRRPAAPVAPTPATPVPSPATDDLSAELRRCGALGPQDAEDARCVAVWEENRRRFFGRPARPLPPQPQSPRVLAGSAAPATPSTGDAR